MRVALVSPYSWTVPGGVNQHIEHLAGELEKRGHQAWMIAPVGALSPSRRAVDSRRHEAAERFIPMGTAVPIPSNGSRSHLGINPKVLFRMDRAIRRGRFDVMHVHEPCTPLVALAATIGATSPVVGTFHAALESSAPYTTGRKLAEVVMRRVDVRIAVSEAAREFPARLFPGDYRVIPNGVATDVFAAAVGAPKVRGRILFIGRAEKRKGLGVLLQAFASVRQRLPHASLVIAGATRRQVLETAAEGVVEAPSLVGVEPLGWIDDPDKLARLGEAEVVCAPSLTAESFGIVLAEAMAAGVPVVASDLRGYRSVLAGGAAGRLVPPDDPALLADALCDLLQDEAERRRLATAGLATAERLSWRRVGDDIEQVYEEAVAMPFRPGVRGRPGRPWFGRAFVDYVLDPRLRGSPGEGAAQAPGAALR